MEKSPRTFVRLALLGGALLASVSIATAGAPKIQTGAHAEVTFDGLHRIENSVMDLAWVKPDINLGHYTKIMLLPAGMTFKDADKRSQQFPLSQQQKEKLRDTVFEAFADELGKSKRFTLVTAPGPDVLQVRGAVLDVVSRVPPDPVGRGGFILRSLGEATLVVELRDSLSDEILARAVDRRGVSPAFPQRSNSVTNLAEVRFAARTWAGQLVRRLDQFTQL